MRTISTGLLSTLFVPALAWAVPVGLSDATSVDVPAGYDIAGGVGCNDVCTYDSATLQLACDVDQTAFPVRGPGLVHLVTNYTGTTPDVFSAWGTDDSGADFGCVLTATADSVADIRVFGDEGDDVLAFEYSRTAVVRLDRPIGWTVAMTAAIDGDVSFDTITGTDGPNIAVTLYGGEGNDQIYGRSPAEQIYGYYPWDPGAGAYINPWTNQAIVGAPESDDDLIKGGEGDDWIWAGPENDSVCGGEGRDVIHGDDHLSFMYGQDRLEGGADDDFLWGQDKKDCLIGYVGSHHGTWTCDHLGVFVDPNCQDTGWSTDQDFLAGGNHQDFLYGGPDRDFLFGSDGDDWLWGHDGDDELDGGPDHDELIGGDGDDELVGGSGDDDLYGDAGEDTLLGGTGADDLFGGANSDRLNGGWGADDLVGGSGWDTLCGGGGGLDAMSDGDILTHYHQSPGAPATVSYAGTINTCGPGPAFWWNTSWCSPGFVSCP